MTKRKAIHGFVSDEAHEGWHAFSNVHMVSISAVLEVLGRRMLLGEAPSDVDTGVLIKEAQVIEHERRQR